jgi:tRNA modification GTPase
MDTIAAIATAQGDAGIGIVRISGAETRAIVRRLTGKPRSTWPQAALRRARIVDPVTDELIDDGLVVVFQAPRSLTGEDVAELQVHGGRTNLSHVLAAVLAAGARLARPGEFTERAFMAGKIDLTQAEAIADLIHARSEAARQAARRQLSGELAAIVADIRSRLVAVLAQIEASIDFPEEVGDPDSGRLGSELSAAAQILQTLLHSARRGRALTEGITLVIAGAPNAGKSSLLNALSGYDRAIVSALPGTTRDIVSEPLVFDGLPVRALDTAGLRTARDPIEAEGVARARAAIDGADVVIQVLTPHDPPEPPLSPNVVFAINKSDLGDPTPLLAALATHWPAFPAVPVSARTREGIGALVSTVAHSIAGVDETPLVTRARQEDALRRCADGVDAGRLGVSQGLPIELIAVDLHGAVAALAALTGTDGREETRRAVFASFCLGK